MTSAPHINDSTFSTYTVCGLHTVVVRPVADPRVILLLRTPYDAHAHLAEARQWAERGVAVVVQDVRGRYRSGGEYRPFDGERDDGFATVTWVLEQSWASAPLILYGASYAAHCAVESAIAAHDARVTGIGGVCVSVPALGLGETARTRDGAFFLESRVGWWTQHGDRRVSAAGGGPRELLGTLPIADIGERARPPITSWARVLDARRNDERRAKHVAALSYPLLAIGGTADWFTQDTIDLWAAWGGPASLVLGPWNHSLRGSGRAARIQRWLADVLADEPPTGLSVHGLAGGPRTLAAWPGARSRQRLPGGAFLSDAARPFPSRAPGSDLSDLTTRPDCLVIPVTRAAGPVLGTPRLRVVGGLGQWAATLAITRLDGRLEQIAHGASTTEAVTLTPVVADLYEGETLVLIISAQAFPRHSRDLHGGELAAPAVMTRRVRRVELKLPT